MKRDLAIKCILAHVAPEFEANRKSIQETDFLAFELDYILKLASTNGLRYIFLKKLQEAAPDDQKVQRYWQYSQDDLAKLKYTLTSLKEMICRDSLKVLLIKMPHLISHIPKDVDLFVPKAHLSQVLGALEKYKLKLHDLFLLDEVESKYWPVDIYTEIKYHNMIGIKPEELWCHQSEARLFGETLPGLTDEMNLIITLLHGFFGHRRLTLLDFLHARKLLFTANQEICCQIAQKNGWHKAYQQMTAKIRELENILLQGKLIHFPYSLSLKFILTIYNSVDGVTLSFRDTLTLMLILIRDRIVRNLENSCFYQYVLRRKKLRYLFNKKLSGITHSLENAVRIKE